MNSEAELLRRKTTELEKRCEQLERALQQSEDRFNKLFHASSNLMTITTLEDGRMVDLNEASANLGGYKREELIGHLSAEHGLFADPKQRDIMVQRLRKEGKVHNLEVRMRTKAGDLRTVLLSADPITVNEESCLLSVSVDITAREKEANALRESEEKYRMLVENSLQGLTIIQDGHFAFCNHAYAVITGYTVEELLSFSTQEIRAMIHPDDRAMVVNRHHDRLAGKQVPFRYEYRGIKKDGSLLWLEVYASLIEYNGKPATQLVYMDITERKQAEEALKESREYLNQIINRIGDPIFVKDREHRFVLINDAFSAFFGGGREELLGKAIMPEKMGTHLWEQEDEVFKSGKECLTEDNLLDWEGNSRTLMAKKSLLTDRNGNQQIVGVLRDVTEFKHLEAQFHQAQKMEAIGVLAGGVAHDFNNLLNVINGYSELILDDLDSDNPLRKDLGQIRDAGKRAAALTSQLLAFGRKQILQPEIIDLNSVTTNMSSMLQRLIGEDIEMVTIAQPGLGLANVDPGQIQQIIMNLAANSRDAMPEGGKLTIETANVDLDDNYVQRHPMIKAGRYVMMAVSDSGIGMDEATQAHLFEPFFTTKEKGRGTGLGLSTVYGIVKQSNGFIWAYSEPQKGTTFKVYFPRIAGEVPEVSAGGKMDSESLGAETLLVVEDEAPVRALESRVLRDRGYNVLEAQDGMEALGIAREYPGEIHMILTDVIMPGMSGNKLVTRLRSVRPGIKALYLSGYTDNAIVHHGMLDSNLAFLQKPFSIENLARKVREVLNSE